MVKVLVHMGQLSIAQRTGTKKASERDMWNRTKVGLDERNFSAKKRSM